MVKFRDYFDDLLAAKKYKNNKTGFYNGVANTKFNNSYFLQFSFPSISRTGNLLAQYEATVSIDFFFDGFSNVSDAIDEGMEKVNLMMLDFLDEGNKATYNKDADKYLMAIDPDSIDLRELENNDRKIVITLTMSVKFNYNICNNKE